MRTRIVAVAALLLAAGCSGGGGPSASSTPAPVSPAATLLGPGLVPPPLTPVDDLGGLLPDPAAALGEDLLPPS